MFIFVFIFNNKLFSRLGNLPSQNIWNLILHYFTYLRLSTSELVRKHVPSLFIECIILVEVVLFFWVILKAWQSGWGLGLIENSISAVFLWSQVIRDLPLTSSVIEWLVDWVSVSNDLIGFVKRMGEVMELFCGGYFFSIRIGALFRQINSKLILNKIANEDSMSVLEDWVKHRLSWHCVHFSIC